MREGLALLALLVAMAAALYYVLGVEIEPEPGVTIRGGRWCLTMEPSGRVYEDPDCSGTKQPTEEYLNAIEVGI